MEFEWDPAKSEATERQRGIAFGRGAEVLVGRTVEWPDIRRDYGELRYRAVGESSGELLHVVYTSRGNAIRIASVRRANRKERALWHSRA